MENTYKQNKREDHKEVTALLISLGIRNKKDRDIYHKYIIACHYGVADRDKFRDQDEDLLNHGYDAWQVVPLEYRRDWQSQPD